MGTPAIRIVGLGDSLTEGVGDPRPGRAGFAGHLDGWLSYVADAIRSSGQPVEVENFAAAGARLEHVMNQQLPSVRTEPADIISCFIGINDLWDANLDLDDFGRRFTLLFGVLSGYAPVVMTASIHDVFAPFPVRAPLRQKLQHTIAAMNEIIQSAVHDSDLLLIDLAGRPELFTSAVRAVDRLHPNRYGHQLIAAEVIHKLHDRDLFLAVKPPTAVPVRRGVQDLAHIAWVSGYVRQNWKRWRTEMRDNRATSD